MANQTKKTGNASGGLYIALAICILSVICIGVYSAILNIFDPPELELPAIEESKNKSDRTPGVTVTTPKVTLPPFSDIPKATEPQPSAPESKPSSDLPELDANALPVRPGYTMPVAGDVDVAFSGETLVYSETMNDYRRHCGVDLASTIGTPVKAFTTGIVLEIYEDPLMGQTVVLDHGSGIKSIYQNLSSQLPDGIEVGAEVKEGEVIGGIGETVLIECAQTPHLHFEVIVDDEHVDPMEYFQ